jgi:hypothetical protein
MSDRFFVALATLALVGAPLAARAQARADSARTHPVCWTARPEPRCHVLLLTNVGAYVDFPHSGGADTPRLAWDLGLMVNIGRRDAVGATFFGTSDMHGRISRGPALRYRRWLSLNNSVELAVGARSALNTVDRGAVTGLIKYNIGPYFGLGLRPEIVQACRPPTALEYETCGGTVSRARLSAGLEIGSRPGAAVVVVAGVIGAVWEIVFWTTHRHLLF